MSFKSKDEWTLKKVHQCANILAKTTVRTEFVTTFSVVLQRWPRMHIWFCWVWPFWEHAQQLPARPPLRISIELKSTPPQQRAILCSCSWHVAAGKFSRSLIRAITMACSQAMLSLHTKNADMEITVWTLEYCDYDLLTGKQTTQTMHIICHFLQKYCLYNCCMTSL